MKYYILSVDSEDMTLTLADSLKTCRLSVAENGDNNIINVLAPGDLLVICRSTPTNIANIVMRKEEGENEFRKVVETENGADITDIVSSFPRSETLVEISAETYLVILKRMLESVTMPAASTPIEEDRKNGGENVLYYGVPGSGKSHTIDEKIGNSRYERVVFHPDYTYSDFVGQIMPRLKSTGSEDTKLTYEFIPGPFTNALKTADDHKNEMVYLIIEEINRGNAPAIFGDIFQLLDREDDGTSKYCITNYDIAKELYGAEYANKTIRIPSNLTILSTMNTSDQNVFTLDTAFQRRWNMKYVPNDVKGADHAADYLDDREEITWGEFAFFVNNGIVEHNSEMSSTEDKQMGAYFIQEDDLDRDHIAEKALKYLWDDVYRMDRYEFFNPQIKSIGQLVETYKNADREPLKRVMRAEVYERMMNDKADSPAEAFDESETYTSEALDEEQ